jgi:hypothetical protein
MSDFFPKELNSELCRIIIQQCIHCKTNIFNVAYKDKIAQYMLLENNNAILVKNKNKSGKYPLIFLKKSDIINSN